MKKIFVAHRASLGDTLLATPTLRAIKETYPHSRTIVMASPSAKDILDGHPFVDELLLYKKGDSIFPIIKKIWRADLALVLDYHYRSSLFAWLACIPQRIGRGSKKKSFLTDQILGVAHPIHTYEADNTLTVPRHVGIDTNNTGLVMAPCREQEKQHVHQLLLDHKIELSGKPIVVIAPYSLADLKDWPEENYQHLIDFLVARQVIVVVVGGQEHRERGEQLLGSINMVGLMNIRETTYLISLAQLVVCGCTSVLHFAATTNTPQVAIYGPTDPEQWAPRENCMVLTTNIACSPCYNTGRECDKDKLCIRQITVSQVCSAVAKRLLL